MYRPRGEYSLEGFESFCSHLLIEPDQFGNERPLVLQDFQKDDLAPHFNGTRELLWLLPKGNGKTSILAALALYHMVEFPEPEVMVYAASRDQATKLFGYVSGFVRRADWLMDYLKVQDGTHRVKRLDETGSLKVLPADPGTVDGAAGTLVLCDELHRWKKGELYAVVRDGLKKRDGARMVGISTAGESEESVLGRIRKRALALEGDKGSVVRVSCHTIARQTDGRFELREWSLKDNDDETDFALVKQANPLASITEASLAESYASTSMERWQWLRFTCNIWAVGEFSAIDAREWRACGPTRLPDGSMDFAGLEEGEECDLGLDVAYRRDTTALVPFVLDSDAVESNRGKPLDEHEPEDIVGIPTVLEPPQDGSGLKYPTIIAAVKAIHARNPVRRLVYDPNQEADQLGQMIQEAIGCELVAYTQGDSNMATAAMGLAEAIRAGKVLHPGTELLTEHVLSCSVKVVSGERWRFDKVAGRKNDAAIALAMVRANAHQAPSKKKKSLTFEETQKLYGMGNA